MALRIDYPFLNNSKLVDIDIRINSVQKPKFRKMWPIWNLYSYIYLLFVTFLPIQLLVIWSIHFCEIKTNLHQNSNKDDQVQQ